MAIGGVAGAVGAGAGIAGGKVLSNARRALRGGDDLAEDAAAAGRAGPSCAHSFAPATAVLLADGSSKPIAQIAVGDTVVATDPEPGETIQRQVVTAWINQDLDLDLTITTAPDPDRPGEAAQVLQTGSQGQHQSSSTTAEASTRASTARRRNPPKLSITNRNTALRTGWQLTALRRIVNQISSGGQSPYRCSRMLKKSQRQPNGRRPGEIVVRIGEVMCTYLARVAAWLVSMERPAHLRCTRW